MKRNELQELTSWLKREADEIRWYCGAAGVRDEKSDNLYAIVKLLESIVQAQPVAWMHDGFVSTNKKRVKYDEIQNRSCGFKARPIHTLYTLPLED